VTEYASLIPGVTDADIRRAYNDAYADEFFIRVLKAGTVPETRWVEGSNFVAINYKVDPRTGRVIMMGALDNLVKGAAGQAVQNMNLAFGLEEQAGLKLVPMFP
jgi:N-acetyl-gamma-glutamyl-phosphate reductase